MTMMTTTMDDNGYSAAVLITSLLSLSFVSGSFNSFFAQVFIYTSYDKKEE
jgi:NADH:ubiquinone oxidoreductase subunit 6 (subunit J)